MSELIKKKEQSKKIIKILETKKDLKSQQTYVIPVNFDVEDAYISTIA